MPAVSQRVVYTMPNMDKVVVQRDLTYRRVDEVELKMDVYAPPNLRDNARVPAVLCLHGGPISADAPPPTQWPVYLSYGELIAASGLIGVTFNHRFHGLDKLDQASEDIKAAMDYVRAHADALRVDAGRLCLWAFSAGGVFLSSVLRERPSYVRCIVAYYAILDVRPFLPPEADAAMQERAQKFSTVTYVKDHAAGLPMFVARAGLDRTAINQSNDLFVQESLAANAMLDFANHPQGQHGFDTLNDDERTREIIARTLGFIKTHLHDQNP